MRYISKTICINKELQSWIIVKIRKNVFLKTAKHLNIDSQSAFLTTLEIFMTMQINTSIQICFQNTLFIY